MSSKPDDLPGDALVNAANALAPRPISAWILLVVLVLVSLLLLVGSVQFMWVVASHFAEISNGMAVFLAVAWRLCALSATLAAAYGIYTRAQWGRWLGLAGIAVWCILGFVNSDTTHYNNEYERAGGVVGHYFAIPLTLAWWAYAFGFSAKSKAYFSKATRTT